MGIRYLKENGNRNTFGWIKNSNNAEYKYQNWFDRHKVTKEELNRQKNSIFCIFTMHGHSVPTYNTSSKLL